VVLGIRVVGDLGDDVAVGVEHADPALQFGDDGMGAADVDGGGHAERLLQDLDEVALEVPVLDAVVVAVADEEQGPGLAGVERDAVAGVELALRGALAAEGLHEMPLRVKLQHVIGAVAVRNEEGTVRRHRHRAGIEPVGVLVEPGLLRPAEHPVRFAGEAELHDFMPRGPGRVDVFHALLLANLERVDMGGPEGTLVFAVGGENHDAALGVGGDVDVACAVDDHAAMAGPELLGPGLGLEVIVLAGVLEGGGVRAGEGGSQGEQEGGKAFHGRGDQCGVHGVKDSCKGGGARWQQRVAAAARVAARPTLPDRRYFER
jgi:hypothetical protein